MTGLYATSIYKKTRADYSPCKFPAKPKEVEMQPKPNFIRY